VTTADVQALIPDLANIYDEPFADSSQLPTILVSQLARQHVTVSLSGDGGDELFAGYERYQWAQTIWKKIEWMPTSARKTIAVLIRLLTVLNSSKSPERLQNIAAKFERLASMLSAENRQFFYRTLISAGVNANQYVLGSPLQEPDYVLNQEQLNDSDFIHQMMYLDIHSYLPDDILAKVDRASMSVSLESRVPLLDHGVVEQAWAMRDQSLQNNLPAKQPLRKILYQYVPKELIERPKKGFAVPLSDWLRGDLLSWAENLLDRDRLIQEAVFDADKVYQIWCDFKHGKAGSEHFIWSVLMFQLWHEKWYS
jgi:asparagine synthase (glutamine-hydrolysing)